MFKWILIFSDAVGVWLLVRPGDAMNLLSARRVPASKVHQFFARALGVIILWTQVTRWVSQAKNTNAEPVLHQVSIVVGIGAVAFLGYHFVGLFASKPDRKTQVEEAKRRLKLPESEEQAKARYRAAWRRYRRLSVAFPLMLLGWLPFGFVLSAIFRFFQWDWHIAMITMLAWIPFISVLSWQWAFWQCPRCGKAFKGKYPFYPKRCYYCGLPKWAESPDE